MLCTDEDFCSRRSTFIDLRGGGKLGLPIDGNIYKNLPLLIIDILAVPMCLLASATGFLSSILGETVIRVPTFGCK